MVSELLKLGNGEIEPESIPPDGREVVGHTISSLERACELLDRLD
jgi:hypothetical protein